MIITAICFVWAGMVLGISFLDTGIKFTLPSVTLAIGLDLGRHVFGFFNKIEICAAILCCVLMAIGKVRRSVWMPLCIVVLIVILQSLWLLPQMNSDIAQILVGQVPPPNADHIVYVALELLKLISLVGAGVGGLLALKRSKTVGA